ncbi:hypothetical protein Gohar_027800, partial [Gossypium harknessii]|nr:hypothetical protein [Gossypium harknessii]
MANLKVIAEHFEATIGGHPKMKLTEIQRRVSSKMHVNVNMTKCRRAKKMVKDKLVGNFVQKFAMLWDYVDELRLKNLGSTIKMAVNRVTSESPPHFKRFYVCFEALKRGPFKGELLAVVGRDGNYQMYLVARVIVEGEYIDSWTWFLSLLIVDLRMKDGFGYTIISDQQK